MKKGSDDDFLYCANLKCEHHDCLRHNCNTPWNVMIVRRKFQMNKDGGCKDKITER